MHARAVVLAAIVAGALGGGCTLGDNQPVAITVLVPVGDPALTAAATEMIALIDHPGLAVRAVADPVAEVEGGRGFRVAVQADRACVECYRIDDLLGGDAAWVVSGGGLLGAQYGLAHALENLGFRFRHPAATHAPAIARFDPAAAGSLHRIYRPAIRVRGVQLDTARPTEGHHALWTPGDANLADARRMIDWTIKNRGNFVGWVALEELLDPARQAAWRAHTGAIVAAAHGRGLRVGLTVQLYGLRNPRRALALWDGPASGATLATTLASRVPLVAGLGFDVYTVELGNRAGIEPAQLVADLDEAVAALRQAAPAAELHAGVDVGAPVRISYLGADLLDAFLIAYAGAAPIPDVHTAMFYDLDEDAGGVYRRNDFAEHRRFLLERIGAGRPVVYAPEASSGGAFDLGVPLALPLYVRNRWQDLAGLAVDPGASGRALDGHVVISRGWEWGYWLHDYAALRASFTLPGDPATLVRDAFGEDLAPAVELVIALIELEHRTLLLNRLMPYLAGHDEVDPEDLDLGTPPDRITVTELAALDGVARARFITNVLTPLDDLAARLAELDARAVALALPDSRWTRELRDGLAITALRARFAVTAYQVALEHIDGNPVGVVVRHPALVALLARARAVVAGRHRDLHEPHAARLIEPGGGATAYRGGSLFAADQLCYWERELRQLERFAGLGTERVPDCLF